MFRDRDFGAIAGTLTFRNGIVQRAPPGLLCDNMCPPQALFQKLRLLYFPYKGKPYTNPILVGKALV